MKPAEGLSLYEHAEADLRPDLFLPRSEDLAQGTSKRLRPDALYMAFRFQNGLRDYLKHSVWRIRNIKDGRWVVVNMVDWGPNPSTGRDFDLSPMAAALLGLDTDDYVEGVILRP